MKKAFLQLGLFMLLSSGAALTACNNQPKDSAIQNDFNDKVKTNPQLTHITASVADGVVTLTGECPDEACRTNAEQNAKEVKGVKSVVNNINVAPASAPVVVADDATLKNSVDAAIKPYNNVSADVANGEVTLRGTIQRDDLQNLMMNINALNPKKVNNQLTVK